MRPARAAIFGSILGGSVGAALTQVILPFYYQFFNPDTNDLILGVLVLTRRSRPASAPVGGAAFGVGFGDWRDVVRAALGGLLGAIAGALVFEMVGAIAFPLDETANPISVTWATRLFARLAVTLLTSIGVAMSVLNEVKRTSPSTVSQDLES